MKAQTTEVTIKDQLKETAGTEALASSVSGSDYTQQLYDLVAQQPFFKGLSTRHLQVLADSAMQIEFKSGEWILSQGDLANRFYLILAGKVVLESELKERGLMPIRTLGAGDDLGWAWLFPPYYMSFSARAIEPVRAIFFYGTRLRQQCEDDHELGYELLKRIAEVVIINLQATQQRLMECADASNLPNLPAATS